MLFSILAYITFLFWCIFPIPFLVPFFIVPQINKKTRLNKQYSYSFHIKEQKYYLHHSPKFLFSYIGSEKFKKYREDAMEKFKKQFPNESLYSKTMTLQELYEEKGYIGVNTKMTFNLVTMSFLGVVLNWRNLFKLKAFRLFRRVYNVKPKEYKIL